MSERIELLKELIEHHRARVRNYKIGEMLSMAESFHHEEANRLTVILAAEPPKRVKRKKRK